ncbi:MAG: hypothetical protein JETCAE03_31800 [Ignavibacteriaceae bacterium]|jgi:Zn finger protein HypA/HybF involved in hydrogenase expression|nr:MAG: hypothetical protein JETCAE03_31800 [Ignavibacteriaceae bacterium]
MECENGCGQKAKYQLKSGKWICSKSSNSCPINRKKNSKAIKKAHKDGTLPNFKDMWKDGRIKCWNKGKNILTDERVATVTKVDEIFVENSRLARFYIKKLIIQQNLLEYKCRDCGLIDEWNGKKLVLELEHINGKNKDYRLENLTFLCPNCHSQTDGFRGRKMPE